MGTIGKENLGGPALPTEDEGASLTIFQGDKGSFMVNWPFVWSATQRGRQGRHPAAVARRRHRLGPLPAGHRGQADGTALRRHQPRRRRVQQARRPGVPGRRVHRDARAPGAVLRDERQPAVQHRRPTTTRRSRRRSRWRTSSGSRWSRPCRDRRRPYYNEVSTGLQQTWHPPSSVDPEDDPEEVHRPDHRRASRGAAAMTHPGGTHQARPAGRGGEGRPQRPRQVRGAARLAPRRARRSS